jgi:hypothetical protein
LLQAQILITDIIKYGISALLIVSFGIAVCDMTPCSVVEIYRRFGRILCLNFQDRMRCVPRGIYVKSSGSQGGDYDD